MGGPIGRKAIKKEQHDSSPPVAEFEGPQSHLVRPTDAGVGVVAVLVITALVQEPDNIAIQLARMYSSVSSQAGAHVGSWCWQRRVRNTCTPSKGAATD